MRSKSAIYNIITNLILQVVAVIYGFVVPKIIIDYFGSEINGLVASITQFLAYITLLESGFGPVVKAALYKPIAKKDKVAIAGILKTASKFFRRIGLFFVIYVMVLCIIFPFIVNTEFEALFTVSLIVVISISIFAEYFFGVIYRLFLESKQKSYVIFIIQTVTYILAITAVVVLSLAGANIIVIKLATALIFVLRPLLQNYYVKRKYDISLKDAPDNYPIKQKWDGLAQHIASVIHNNTDVVVLTIFTSLSEVSVYSVYCLVTTGIKKVIQPFHGGFDSLFGDMIAKNEQRNLNNRFSTYELLYMIFVTVLFTSALLLITPFVGIYTKGVNDVDYIRPLFGYLIVLSDYIWAIRLPYSTLITASGHFRETRKGAWVEAAINIILSVILVFHFGLIGVAIGTVVAMLVRTVEFIYHTNKCILRRNILGSVKKIILSVAVMIIVFLVSTFMPAFSSNGYIEWIIDAVIVVLLAGALCFILYGVIYRKEMGLVLKDTKKFLKRKRKNVES